MRSSRDVTAPQRNFFAHAFPLVIKRVGLCVCVEFSAHKRSEIKVLHALKSDMIGVCNSTWQSHFVCGKNFRKHIHTPRTSKTDPWKAFNQKMQEEWREEVYKKNSYHTHIHFIFASEFSAWFGGNPRACAIFHLVYVILWWSVLRSWQWLHSIPSSL